MKRLTPFLCALLMSFAAVAPAYAAAPTAHTGLNISEADWNKTVQYLGNTLDKLKLPEKEKSEVLGAISGLKGGIVGR